MIGAVLGRGRRRGAGWRVGVAASMLAASTVVSIAGGVATSATTAPTDLDLSFGTAGLVTQSASSAGTGVAVVPPGVTGAGETVVSGFGGSPTKVQVARYTASGTLDTGFGGGVVSSIAGEANGIAVVPLALPHAGDVVVAGYSATATCGGTRQPVVAEYTPGGALDTTFNTTGSANTTGAPGTRNITCPSGAFDGTLNGVTIDANGNIVVAGQVTTGTGTLETLVARVTPTGTNLDSTFNSTGVVALAVGSGSMAGSGNSAAEAVAVSPLNGDIITTGYSYPAGGGSTYLTVIAFTSAGQLDGTFNCSTSNCVSPTAGVVTTANEPGSIGSAITVLPNGTITAAGAALVGSRSGSLLAQFASTGAPTSFGTSGQVVDIPVIGDTNELHALTYLGTSNVLIAAGSAFSGGSQEMVVAQYDATTGALNPSFGTGGVLQDSTASGPSSLAGVAIQADGKTVAVGVSPTVNAAPSLGLVRLLEPQLFVSEPQTRVCDTRLTAPTNPCRGTPLASAAPLVVPLPAGVVPAGAAAVVADVTVMGSSALGSATIFPTGQPQPSVLNMNFGANLTAQDLVTVATGSTGAGQPAITVAATPGIAHANVVVDVEGYYVSAGTAPTGGFQPLVPARVADTRCSVLRPPAFCPAEHLSTVNRHAAIGPGGQEKVTVAGVGAGVPIGGVAGAVVVDVTVLSPSSAGVLAVGGPTVAAGSPATVNFVAGEVVANKVIVPVSAGGTIYLYNSAGTTNVAVDVEGWYSSAAGPLGSTFAPVPPAYVADTRCGVPGPPSFCASESIPSANKADVAPAGGQSIKVTVGGTGVVPSSIDAAVLDLTDFTPPVANTLTAYPSGGSVPPTTDVTWSPADLFKTVHGAAYATTGTNASVNIANQPVQAAKTNIVAALFGYYVPRSAATP